MLESDDAKIGSSPTQPATTEERRKFIPNPIAIIFIFILFTSLTAWLIVTSLALRRNVQEEYPKAVIAVPLLFLLCFPPIASLFVIQFRTIYTLFTDEHVCCEPLDLVRNEKHRQLFLLPLGVSGMVMTILPAYYFHYKKYFIILACQGVLGVALLSLFLGIALIPEKVNNNTGGSNSASIQQRIFLTITEK